jgi:hypothetical protein
VNNMTDPGAADIGDRIEHDLMPGFVMAVQAVEPCLAAGTRPQPHSAYRITDPEGGEDWLCAYDVTRVG